MRSSFCNFGDCLEVEFAGELVLVRNSARPGVGAWFTHDEWAAFLAGVRNGEFDVPDGDA